MLSFHKCCKRHMVLVIELDILIHSKIIQPVPCRISPNFFTDIQGATGCGASALTSALASTLVLAHRVTLMERLSPNDMAHEILPLSLTESLDFLGSP